ncbi:MmyB family transcriptional regulator [Streptomyces griseofuscus]|uniref:MmyB family transcriptional regulator n=1 Tax=Streptomyces griseofuscus TaxID=146922 RepID=UPI0034564BA5
MAGRGRAHLRAAWAAHPEDRKPSSLVAECATQDENFARLWSEREVSVNGRGRKLLGHPVAGAITVTSKSCCRSMARYCAFSSTTPRTRRAARPWTGCTRDERAPTHGWLQEP